MNRPRKRDRTLRKAQELLVFWGQFRSNFSTTGAVLPSGKQLATAITNRMERWPEPARYLEVGPGTGAFTHAMIERLRPGDHLTLVEINDEFVRLLERRMERDVVWRSKRDQIHIINQSVESMQVVEPFHTIVCGLPFNNFPVEVVDSIFDALMGYLTPGGWFSFFEYLAIRKLRAPFTSGADRARMQEVADCLGAHLNRWKVDDDVVLRNFPPAVVHHLRQPQDVWAGEEE